MYQQSSYEDEEQAEPSNMRRTMHNVHSLLWIADCGLRIEDIQHRRTLKHTEKNPGSFFRNPYWDHVSRFTFYVLRFTFHTATSFLRCTEYS